MKKENYFSHSLDMKIEDLDVTYEIYKVICFSFMLSHLILSPLLPSKLNIQNLII